MSAYVNRDSVLKYMDMLAENMPIGLLENKSHPLPLLPYYHMISNENIPHIRHLYSYKNETQFIDDVDFLCRRYDPISLVDIMDYVKRGKRFGRGGFLLSFDDGYSQMYSVVAPALYKKGIPAIFFLTTDFIDNKALGYRNKASILIDHLLRRSDDLIHRTHGPSDILNAPLQEIAGRILSVTYKDSYRLDDIAGTFGISFLEYLRDKQPFLTSAQIEEMVKMGFYIGAHSKDHPPYADLTPREQLDQTIGSLQFIKNKFNLSYSIFSFPHHDRGLADDIFSTIKNHADLIFGAQGHLPRISFENPEDPAGIILKRAYFRRRYHRFLGRFHQRENWN